MTDRKGTSAAGPVVICCASADADTIRSVVKDLEDEGHTVALLDGIENDLELLAPTVESFSGEGLYVLCRSKALGRRAVDELRDVLLAHHVPFGRTLTVASTRPKELRERIGASLRRLTASGATSAPAHAHAKTRASKATRFGMAPAKSPPKAGKEPAKEPAKGPAKEKETPSQAGLRAAQMTQLGIVASRPTPPKAQGAQAQPKPSPPPPPPPPPKVPAPPKTARRTVATAEPTPAEPEPPANLVPAVDPEPGAGPAPVEPIIDPLSGAVIQADELADLDALVEAESGPGVPPPVRSGNTEVVPAISRSQLQAIRTGDTALVSREALLAAGLDVEAEEDPAEAPAPTSLLEPALPQPALAQSDDEGPSRPPWMWIGIGGAALALVAVIAIAFSGDDDDAADDAVAQADDATPSEGAQDDPEGPEGEGANEADGDEAGSDGDSAEDRRTRIGHALRSRAVRSLDVLLVSNTTGPLTWSAAAEHCADLDVEGIAQWRLPEVGELMSLTGASMTERGYYWTATPADTFGDTRLAWYARRSRVVPRSRESLALCVRGGSASG